MKLVTIISAIFIIYGLSLAAVDTDHRFNCSLNGKVHIDQVNFDFEGKTLVMTPEDDDGSIVESV